MTVIEEEESGLHEAVLQRALNIVAMFESFHGPVRESPQDHSLVEVGIDAGFMAALLEMKDRGMWP